jgi:YHS domain-containing protein
MLASLAWAYLTGDSMNLLKSYSSLPRFIAAQRIRGHKRLKLSLLITSLALMVIPPSQAIEPTFTALFSDTAIRGYDTVAYFTEGRPVEGKAKYSSQYNQATWLFSSQDNLELFEEDPEKYAPQYGGYCAYAVSQNKTASIKPELFTIVNGKLYLNYNASINQKWTADKVKFIMLADKHWPKLLAQ